jgi:hypothetical protein
MQNRGASSPTTGHQWTGSYRPSAAPAIGAATGSAKVGKRQRRSRGCWGDAHRGTDEERWPEIRDNRRPARRLGLHGWWRFVGPPALGACSTGAAHRRASPGDDSFAQWRPGEANQATTDCGSALGQVAALREAVTVEVRLGWR